MIQRAIEQSGIPTVAVVNLKDRAERVRIPRAVVVKFPRGATLGPPGHDALQRQIIRDALSLLQTADGPVPPVELDYRWNPGSAAAAGTPGAGTSQAG